MQWEEITKKIAQRFLAASNFWKYPITEHQQYDLIYDWIGELLPIDIGTKDYWNEVADEIYEGVLYELACHHAGVQLGISDAAAQFMGMLYHAQYAISGSVRMNAVSYSDMDLQPF